VTDIKGNNHYYNRKIRTCTNTVKKQSLEFFVRTDVMPKSVTSLISEKKMFADYIILCDWTASIDSIASMTKYLS
jgi:hypothetical protein